MATDTAGDYDIFKSLWDNINDICAPGPPPGAPAKACFLMEMPGFSIDPDAFDPSKFDPAKMVSPSMATATLCDRVPAIARYFYDTGNHISFLWEQYLRTFAVKPAPPRQDETLKANYDEAIKMLYGSQEGYVNQTKTQLYKNLDPLRQAWQDAITRRNTFRSDCQTGKDKANWPANYEKNAGPYNDAVEQAYTDYNNLRLQIEKYEAAIFAYVSGDLTTMMLRQENRKSCCEC